MSLRLGAINVVCTDLRRSLRFYHEALGFELIENQGWFAHLRCDGRDVTLLGVAKEPNPRVRYCQRPCMSFDLTVTNLAAMLEALQREGVPLASGHPPTPERAFIEDPDGLVLELI